LRNTSPRAQARATEKPAKLGQYYRLILAN
jgi:hypothetical protein